jgi:hypothetical protein
MKAIIEKRKAPEKTLGFRSTPKANKPNTKLTDDIIAGNIR